jgi:G3E family GTPase
MVLLNFNTLSFDYSQRYLEKIFENYKQDELSYFEMNMETWRQLWRVLEISDIILLIVDIRFPALHFSPAFYKHCVERLNKQVILVLNKIDLVPISVVVAWKDYFRRKFPNLHILLFSSSKQIKHKRHQKQNEEKNREQTTQEEQELLNALAAEIYTARAHRQLYECVKSIVQHEVDLTSWSNLTERLIKNATDLTNMENSNEDTVPNATANLDHLTISNEDTSHMDELFNSKAVRKRFENGFVTIGCCGKFN